MKLRDWKDVIDVDLPEPGCVTDATREYTRDKAKHFRASMRIATGRFWTNREYEEYRAKILNSPLP